MHPTSTLYRLADNPSDYRACHAILRANNQPKWTLHWPTVVAERDGKIIGFLATNKSNWCHLVGPLELAQPSHFITAIRLLEAYENLMRFLSVTSYCFFIERKNDKWLQAIKDFGFVPIKANPEAVWFERILAQPYRLAA